MKIQEILHNEGKKVKKGLALVLGLMMAAEVPASVAAFYND